MSMHPNDRIIYAATTNENRPKLFRIDLRSDGTSALFLNEEFQFRGNFRNSDTFIAPSGDFLISRESHVYSISEERFTQMKFETSLNSESYQLEDIYFDENRDLLYAISSDSVLYYQYDDFSFIKADKLDHVGRFAGVYGEVLYVLTQEE